jgi:phosphoribosylformimino-5-aminoimidazole carboxamide ribotide isomerase
VIVYPAIDLRRGRCVRLAQGDPQAETVFSDDPAATAQRWANLGAEWLHVVNLDGAFGDSAAGSDPARGMRGCHNMAALRAILGAVSVPVQLGGGLRTVDDVGAALALGVARAIIGTAALSNPEVVREAVSRFGSERVAVALDVRDGRVATHGWSSMSDVAPVELALRMKDCGISRVVYTDISRDGMLSGVNAEACAALAQASGLGVIASGGVASLDDVRRVGRVEQAGVEGIIIGKALYSGQIDLREALEVAGSTRPVDQCRAR